jgi:F0F1-type ATP synthase membrane subunit c/vacuolar-type H+-ATPase subunit K
VLAAELRAPRRVQESQTGQALGCAMNEIIYLIGLIVVVMFILSVLGLR